MLPHEEMPLLTIFKTYLIKILRDKRRLFRKITLSYAF